jgi:hypothetical protein
MRSKPASALADDVTSNLQANDADHDSAACPAPLDCGDLTETFHTDMAAAVRLLMILTSVQLKPLSLQF